MPEQGSPDTHARRADDTAAPDPSARVRDPGDPGRPPPAGRRPAAHVGADLPDRHVLERRHRGAGRGPDRPAAGLRVRPHRQPDDGGVRPGGRRARGRRGRRRASRPGWPRSTRRSCRCCRPATGSSRRRRRTARRGPSSSGVLARLGVDVDVRRRHGPRGGRARPSPRRRRRSSTPRRSRTRRSSSPTTRPSPTSPIATARLYVVDNTFASPYLCRPIELGADLVVESATKYLAGHSDVLAGVVVRRRRAWSTASASVQVDTGATLAPMSAFLALRGLSTLAIRMDRHAATAAALAAWLERQPGVSRVYHPALASHPQHEVASRELRAGGGMLAFELAGGRDAGARVHRRADDPGADGLARQRLHDRRPPALDDAPPARRRGARPGRDHRRACSACRSGWRTSTTSWPTSSGGSRPREATSAGRRRCRRRPARARGAGGAGRTHPGRPLGAGPIASPAATLSRARAPELNPPARLGRAIWGLLTSVNFAVIQIIILSVLAVIGMTVRQLPSFAFRSASDYDHRDEPDPRPLRPRPRRGSRDCARAAPGLPHLHVDVVPRLARRPGGLDHLLHARPDAAAVAPVERDPGRPAGAVLRPRRCPTGRR